MNEHVPSAISSASAATSAQARVALYDWQALAGELDNYGCAVLPKLLSAEECRTIAALYPDESHFRSHIHMARHGFGRGEYRYFKYPLPDATRSHADKAYIRASQPLHNEWNGRMGIGERYPDDQRVVPQAIIRDAGQTRPRHHFCCQYVAGDFNCLHQKTLYGGSAHSRSPGRRYFSQSPRQKDFTEWRVFVLTIEQRPRMARAAPKVVPTSAGRFPAIGSPLRVHITGKTVPRGSKRATHRVNLRHGVSRSRSSMRAHSRESSSTTQQQRPCHEECAPGDS